MNNWCQFFDWIYFGDRTAGFKSPGIGKCFEGLKEFMLPVEIQLDASLSLTLLLMQKCFI